MSSKTVTFLIVEDDIVDLKALQRAFEKVKVANPIRHARDGIEALDILRGTGGHEKIDFPYVVLLEGASKNSLFFRGRLESA